MTSPLSFTTKPPLGGWLPSVALSLQQIAVLNAFADELIPPGDGFPAPSEVNVIEFIARYVAPAGQEAKWFPYFGEDSFKARVEAFPAGFTHDRSEAKIAILQTIEREQPEFFTRLRDLIYLAYYSRPEVVRAINRNLEAGKDYRATPQPYGYSDNMLDWDTTLLSRVRGTYKRTDAVKRVNLEGIAR
jgi:hypothetical protein